MTDLGKIAYEAYGKDRDWRTFDGSPMPSWDEQTEGLQRAWRLAANAVAAHVTGAHITGQLA